jgi:DNA-binding NarL/FixJ family response regulator
MSQAGHSDGSSVVRTIVADDTPQSLDAVCVYLAALRGMTVVARARDGAAAVAAAADAQPDLVVLDYNMPVLNGIEAARQIKALPAPPKVVLLTFDDTPDVRQRAREAGADGVCAKTDMDPELAGLIAGLFPGSAPG